MVNSKKIYILSFLFTIVSIVPNIVTPTLVFRSQGRHADRQKMVGMTNHTHLFDKDELYGTLGIGVGYMRSFREDRIARCLFGSDLFCSGECPPTIKVQGSNVTDRDPKAWLADYFYLNCNFEGEFSIKPRIQNVVVDLDLYVDLNEWTEGLYFRIYGPINWTKWETNFCSFSETSITSSCRVGYLTALGNEVLLSRLSDYFRGASPDPVLFAEFQPLKYAKIPNCDQTQTGFADLRVELSYDFLQDENYHFGLNIQAAAPTGNRRYAQFVMDPVVGNGNHWELGGGVSAHYTFSRNEYKNFSFYLDANLTHLFQANEQRTFDLKGKNNSRYMLAAKMTKNVDRLSGRDTPGTAQPRFNALFQFDNVYAPVANLTTMNVKVNIGIQADIVAMFNWQRNGFNIDFGYNFWGRTCENIKCPVICDPCDQSLCALEGKEKWVLKGDSSMFGYINLSDRLIPLSPSQSNATIHEGTNSNFVDKTGNCTNVVLQNCGIDNAKFAINANNFLILHTPISLGGVNNNSNQIKTSIQPILLSCDDIDFQQTRGISHTIFGHLSYTWERAESALYTGIGGSVEFGKLPSCCDQDLNCCDLNDCKNCIDCALSQWSVWIKGGISFN